MSRMSLEMWKGGDQFTNIKGKEKAQAVKA